MTENTDTQTESCSCGSREAYSLTPGEWIDHQPDVCKIVSAEEQGA